MFIDNDIYYIQQDRPMHNLQFYRVESFNYDEPFLANSLLKLQQLSEQFQKKQKYEKFTIFYHWKQLQLNKYGNLTLKQIVEEDPTDRPVFFISMYVNNDDFCEMHERYGKGIANMTNTDQKPKQYWIGSNGHVLFDSRNTAILASSVHLATSQSEYSSLKSSTTQKFNSSMIERQNSIQQPKQGLFQRIFTKLGIISKDPSSKNLNNTIQAIKSIKTKQNLKQHINRQYSDYDPKFAAYLESIYIKFAILSALRIHYVEYRNLDDGIIRRTIYQNDKIGIIGDFGTGLADSINLLTDLIINKGVNIILHLGDVYYAGTPHEYENHITKILQGMRLKTKRQVLFYSIPGNHDYYSWGLPFLCFIKQINSDEFTRQFASYFCLRSYDNKWQFLGLDTAYHDSNPINQINGTSIGPSIRKREIKWFEDKMQTFPGSTILLTHHQLFSIHERLSGQFTSYRHFSCINPLISAQIFKYIPHISAWFWGHQHSFMLFDEGISGTGKCRLLGNSSFHVFEQENPYKRKPGFPIIPFIEKDSNYYQKYLPVNPKVSHLQNTFFNLCYTLIDFAKADNQGLFAEYYCCPCFNSQDKKTRYFQPYLLYQQILNSRKKLQTAKTKRTVQIKSEIGLFIQNEDHLSLGGSKFIVNTKTEKEHICDGDIVKFFIVPESYKSFLEGRWFIIHKKHVLGDIQKEIKLGDSFSLQCYDTKTMFLCCKIGINGPHLAIDKHQGLFMLIQSSKIIDQSNPYNFCKQ